MNSFNKTSSNQANIWYHQFNTFAKKILHQNYPQLNTNNSYLQKHRLRTLINQIKKDPNIIYQQQYNITQKAKYHSQPKYQKQQLTKQKNKKQKQLPDTENLYFYQKDLSKQKNSNRKIFRKQDHNQKAQQQTNQDNTPSFSPNKRKKISIFNKSKQLNYPANDDNKWFKQIHSLFGKIFYNQNGCNCQQPCSFSIFLIQWSQSAKFYKYDLYSNLKSMTPDKTFLAQINKDIVRTQPNLSFFQNKTILGMFSRILIAYSVYDKNVGYVQGMNFILASLLYHIKDQQKCFYVFFKLMKQQRQLFLNNFNQVYRHINILKQYVKNHMNDLYHHLIQLQIDLETFCFPWILSMLTILVDIEYIHLIFKQYIVQGWKFIYRVIITYLLYLKQQILKQIDSSEIFVLLSVSGAHKNKIQWDQIIKNSKIIKIYE